MVENVQYVCIRLNHKRVYRIYRELELNLYINSKKRFVREQPKPEPLSVPTSIDLCWLMDFMHGELADSRNYRLVNVIDGYNREGLAFEVDFSLPANRVVRALDRIIANPSGYAVIMAQNTSAVCWPPGL